MNYTLWNTSDHIIILNVSGLVVQATVFTFIGEEEKKHLVQLIMEEAEYFSSLS